VLLHCCPIGSAESREFPGQKNAFLKLLDSRLTGVALTIGTVILVAYGRNGDWENFVQWQTSRFIHVMSLDFTFLPIVSSTPGR